MNISTNHLVQAVQSVISGFEQTSCGSKLTVQELADMANSSYTTIREIKKGVLKNLSVKKALEISSRLNGPQTVEELLGDYTIPKEDMSEITRRYSHLFDYSILPSSQDQLFGQREFSKILWAAFSSNHITKREIEYRWGKEGLDRLNYLLEINMVKEEDGFIKGITKNAGGGPLVAIEELKVGLNEYKVTNREKELNWVSFQTNSVSEKFVKEFREELRDVFTKFNQKSSNKKYAGDRQTFFGMILDTYLDQLDSDKEVRQ